MPVARGPPPALEGRRLTNVEQPRPDLRFPLPDRFAARLEGRIVTGLRRRAKYIVASLDDGAVWTTHLGMSGRFTVREPGVPDRRASSAQAGQEEGWAIADAHDHIVLRTDAGAVLTYNDTRRFGYMDLFPESEMAEHPRFRDLGPEPLGNAFNGPWLAEALAGKATPIKAALLDQKVVAGLGNIYVCEALFRAGLSPRRLARDVKGARAERLAAAVRDVLAAAIEAGGSSLRDYVQASGELGYFQHSFQVYGREGDPCPKRTCDGVVKRIVQSGRSSFYCSRCQR